ncbi:MAG: PspA/IM30 family protein [Nitriliruptorales bacterium]|nr:PspA/IM30 family protein [Nitriliruptorales bacterium]
MGQLLKRIWRYLTAALTGKFEQAADPKVQIEQAIAEAQQQHRALTERAASVIANQKKAEMDLDRSMGELEKLNGSTRQAIMMAEDAQAKGDDRRATELTGTAEAFANQLISKEEAVENLKALVLQSTQASDQAKQAVNQNAMRLQERLAERRKLLSQLDQAKMQEQMNAALESVSTTIGQEVPSLEQVRGKIEARYAKARGMSELQANSVEGRMLEVEQAAMNAQAKERLSEIKSRLGIEAGEGSEAAGAISTGETESVPQPAPESDSQPAPAPNQPQSQPRDDS